MAMGDSSKRMRLMGEWGVGHTCVVRMGCKWCCLASWYSSGALSMGRIRAMRPVGFKRRILSARRSERGSVWLCLAVVRCLSGEVSEALKYGGLETMRSY